MKLKCSLAFLLFLISFSLFVFYTYEFEASEPDLSLFDDSKGFMFSGGEETIPGETFNVGKDLGENIIYYVAWDADGSEDGSSWENAFKTISQAVAVANNTENIWVKKGSYMEQVILNNDIALYGGFAGNETQLDQRNISLNETILNGTGMNYSEVLMTKGRIDGFTILGGQGTKRDYLDWTNSPFGGCILIDPNSENPIIMNCIMRRTNTGEEGGCTLACLYSKHPILVENCRINSESLPEQGQGGVFLGKWVQLTMRKCFVTDSFGDGIVSKGNDMITLEDCEITSNELTGMAFKNSHVDLKGCVIKNNRNLGMSFESCVGNIVNCDIIENSSKESKIGGGIYLFGHSSPMFYNCLVKDNHSETHEGGGIRIWQSCPTFVQCRIEGNTAFDGSFTNGGGVYISDSPYVHFYNTMFLNNYTSESGGACYIRRYSNVYFSGCVFSGNHASWSNTQAMYIREDSNVIMINSISTGHIGECIFYINAQPEIPPPVYTYANLYITNCILWDASSYEIKGSQAFVDHSCIRGGLSGEGNISSDPLFIDEGYTSKTAEGDWLWEEGYYMLQSKALGFPEDSPCIDAGTMDIASNDAALPPGQGTKHCDMGAFGGPYNEGWEYYLVGPLANYMMGLTPCFALDANNDTIIDIADILDLINYISPIPPKPLIP